MRPRIAVVLLSLVWLGVLSTCTHGWPFSSSSVTASYSSDSLLLMRETSPCDFLNVRMWFFYETGSPSCNRFQVLVNSTVDDPSCPFSPLYRPFPPGAMVCDLNRERCVNCLSVTVEPGATGLLFTCDPLPGVPGNQIINASWIYGPVFGSIYTVQDFNCPYVPSTSPPPYEDCRSNDVRMSLLPGPRSCGAPFQVVVNSTVDNPNCPFAANALVSNGGATGAVVCDPNREECIPCLSVQTLPGARGLLYTCQPTNFDGVQTIEVGYRYGLLDGTIATADSFGGCESSPSSPISSPPTPPPTLPPSCVVGFYLAQGCRSCGVPFQAVMYGAYGSSTLSLVSLQDPRCLLTTSGAQVCDNTLNKCVPCNAPVIASDSGFVFNCLPTEVNGFQVVVANFSFNGSVSQFSGNASASDVFSGCSSTPN